MLMGEQKANALEAEHRMQFYLSIGVSGPNYQHGPAQSPEYLIPCCCTCCNGILEPPIPEIVLRCRRGGAVLSCGFIHSGHPAVENPRIKNQSATLFR
jgi:hypothetical protein